MSLGQRVGKDSEERAQEKDLMCLPEMDSERLQDDGGAPEEICCSGIWAG